MDDLIRSDVDFPSKEDPVLRFGRYRDVGVFFLVVFLGTREQFRFYFCVKRRPGYPFWQTSGCGVILLVAVFLGGREGGSRVNFDFVSIDDPVLLFGRYWVVGAFLLVTVSLGGRGETE